MERCKNCYDTGKDTSLRKIIICLLFFSLYACAQSPSLLDYKVSEISPIYFSYDSNSKKDRESKSKRLTEIPPWITMIDGWKAYFFVDGRKSNIWLSKVSLTQQKYIHLETDATGPFTVTLPYINEEYYSSSKNIENWKRNYHAIYSAQTFTNPKQGSITLGFCHNENKNEITGNTVFGTYYQNTIQSKEIINVKDPQTWSGGNPYHDGWKAYNGILTALWMPDSALNNGSQSLNPNELGPIAWPSTGYITPAGIKCTSGLRHPSSILYHDSIYIFFVDAGVYANNIPQEQGRQEGIKVLRVHKNDALQATNYRIYYKDPQGAISWNPSLPDGFTKETMLDYVAVKGPKSTAILNDTLLKAQEIRFSVAKVANSAYFLGVEQYIDYSDLTASHQPKFKVALRYSKDLINWSGREFIIYVSSSWETSKLNYPIFLNKEGTSNTEIDANDFYVIGSEATPADHINKVRVSSSSAIKFPSENR